MLEDIANLSMYVVPKGYNIQKSVYAIDGDFTKGTAPRPDPVPSPAEAVLEAELETGGHKKTDTHKEKEEDTKETKGSAPQPGVVTQPGELEAGKHKEKEKHEAREEDKGREEETNEAPPKHIGPWTPGLVRYAAMTLVVADWENLHEFVECAGATPTEKLANFKKGMARHAVTEVDVVDDITLSFTLVLILHH